jgi:hypothetical protein
MVTVNNFNVRQRKDGETFIVLTLTGGLELVQSQTNGLFRAVVRKCQIPANFDEATAKMVVGTQLPGQIVRVQADPWTFTDQKSGEVITLSHRWSYLPEGATVPVATPEMEEELS